MKQRSRIMKLVAGSAMTMASVTPVAFAAGKDKPAITMAQARATAQHEVPDGKIKSAEPEHEDGQFIYSFDVKAPNGVKEVWGDAMTGKFVKIEHESAAKEKAEKAQEAKEAKQKKAKHH